LAGCVATLRGFRCVPLDTENCIASTFSQKGVAVDDIDISKDNFLLSDNNEFVKKVLENKNMIDPLEEVGYSKAE